jgi:cardiolipin synthase
VRHFAKFVAAGTTLLVVLGFGVPTAAAGSRTTKQESLDEWRTLTSSTSAPPMVFVKGDVVDFYFTNQGGVTGFRAEWSRLRVPTEGYRVNLALLKWDRRLDKVPDTHRSWRQATVIAGVEWRQLATNLLSDLTPPLRSHAAYYQAFLADRVLYRDAQGVPRFALLGEQPKDVVIDHSFSIDETLEALARLAEEHLAQTHPGDSLFLLMAPNAKRFTQPLLLDRQRRRCVFLAPAALYDTTERGGPLSLPIRGVSGLLLESHGLALIKNPISSAARLCDLGVETLVRFLRLPLPKPSNDMPPLSHPAGMDLAAWEGWLDRYTGTRREDGSLRLLIDGDQFFPRFRQALDAATNYIHLNLYIFDRDDVAVKIADQLKERSRQVDVKVIMDRMGSIGAGTVPPSTPMPEDFVMPSSITSYLKEDSRVQVRPFLNPWFSSDHSKVLLVDGAQAWLGGMNLGREYRFEWHDLMVEVGGPVVGSFEAQFRRQWAHAGLLGDLAYSAAWLSEPKPDRPPPHSDQWMLVRRLPTKTAWKPFATAVLGSLRKAQSYIYVENPYLFDKRVIIGLVKARNRGVDVRVVLPRVNDFKAGGRGNLVIANYLLEHGVRVYFYPGMTHVKALLADDWACLGSGNLNHLSLRLNQEENIASSDPAFAAQLKKDLFEADFSRSYELTQPISVDWVDFLADLVLEGL